MTARACVGGRGALPDLAPYAGPLWIRDHGPRGVWVEGDAAQVEALSRAWAGESGAAARVYRATVSVDGAEVVVELRAWVVEPDGATRPLTGVTDDDRAGWDGASLEEIAAERLAIALEMGEQLHHEDSSETVHPG